MERKKVLNYRSANGITPNPDNIAYGEIAIGYKKDNEAIYIKNSTDEIVDFTPTSIVSLTYSQLKELRDNSKLKPSQYYRITDFVTTVANDPEAQSAGHPFDIIVLASDTDKLQEECYAIQHEGDTYFTKCNLAAWKIWYCLDNDNTKYMWADTINGKGVIYRMIDEWQNDCPYDFKNVQFKRYRVTDVSANGELSDLNGTYIGYNSSMTGLSIDDTNDFTWVYTFTYGPRDKEEIPVDASNKGLEDDYSSKAYYGDNIIKPSTCYIVNDVETNMPFCLNNIVWYDVPSYSHGVANNIIVESECVNMTLSGSAHHIGYDNRNFIMGSNCMSNTIGSGGDMNTFGDWCSQNSFKNDCMYNLFGAWCQSNSFGTSCSGNSFGNFSGGNITGDGWINNTFGTSCIHNTFGTSCTGNTFGYSCEHNTFGNDCNNNTFEDNCSINTFGNECSSNTFENNCDSHTFGNNCSNNTFRSWCNSNKFGNSCNNNTVLNNCTSNTFGVACSNNSFGSYFQSNTVGNDVQYVQITTAFIYHTQVLNGTKGTSSKNLTIGFTPKTAYSQFAGLTSENVLEMWVEADTPHYVIDSGEY